MEFGKKILPILLGGALAIGPGSVIYGADDKPAEPKEKKETAETLDSRITADDETARELKIMRTEITGAKSFGDNEGYKGNIFVRAVDKPHHKLFIRGSYQDVDLRLEKTEAVGVGDQTKVSKEDQNYKITKLNPEFYFRTKGDDTFLTLNGGYEAVLVESKADGSISVDGLVTPRDVKQEGHANIVYLKPGIKLGGEKNWVHLEGMVKKVYSNLDEHIGGGSQELFAGVDNSPLIYGGRLNIKDVFLLDALDVKPEKGPKSQIYVASVLNNFKAGDGTIDSKATVEFLNKYFDREQQWRFTEMFKYETPGGKIIDARASYKTDGDVRAELFLPLSRNIQIGAGYQRDEFRGYEKGKNKSFDVMLKVSF